MELLSKILRTVEAQDVPTTINNPITWATNTTSLSAIFALVMNVVMGVGIALTVVFLGIAGISYMTSQGDAKKAQASRDAATNAGIGFVIVVGALTIRIVVGNIIGSGNTGSLNNVTI